MTDREAMAAALREAEEAARCGEIPVGAVLLQGGQLIAAAHNEREARQDPTAHAELLCLQRAAAALGRRRLTGATLYVTLEPCPMCAGAILLSRVDRVVYGAADPQAGCCGSVYDIPADPAFGAGIPWEAGLLAPESHALLNRFFAQRRKI